MEHFKTLMFMIYDFLKTPFNVWGFEFSFWGIIVLVCITSLVSYFLYGLFGN